MSKLKEIVRTILYIVYLVVANFLFSFYMAANNYSFNTAYSFFAGILIAIVGMVMFGFFWEPVPVVETKVDSDHPYR